MCGIGLRSRDSLAHARSYHATLPGADGSASDRVAVGYAATARSRASARTR